MRDSGSRKIQHTQIQGVTDGDDIELQNWDVNGEIPRAKGDNRDTVDVSDVSQPLTFRTIFKYLGIGLQIAIGFADPGNWASNISAGSQFGYRLVWVLFLSNVMAILLQNMSARVGVVTRYDIAALSRIVYPRRACYILWALAELAIAATDVAEVIGAAIALKLLFGLDLVYGVLLTGLDTLVFLLLNRYGARVIDAFIGTLFAVIFVCFIVELAIAAPPAGKVLYGFVPYIPSSAVYIATSVIGATLMPHNLILQSGLVLSRKVGDDPRAVRRANRVNLIDTVVSLNLAFFVNLAILLVAAAAFYDADNHSVETLQDAHRLLSGSLGSKAAPVVFALALLAAGSSSTITATMAGQIVMEGFIDFKMRPWLRRLVSRAAAIVPAVITVSVAGEAAANDLLVLSQVILSLELPFTIVPLLKFAGSKDLMGDFASSRRTMIVAWIVAVIVLALNVWLVIDTMIGAHWAVITVLTLTLIGLLIFLLWIVWFPMDGVVLPPPPASSAPTTVERGRGANRGRSGSHYGLLDSPETPVVAGTPPGTPASGIVSFSDADASGSSAPASTRV